MLILDTDHFSEWERDSAPGERLRARLGRAQREVAVAIVTVEELMRGWLAEVHRRHDLHRQIMPYGRLKNLVELLAKWTILPWDDEAAASFIQFRHDGVRIGTMDLKIACIALAYDCTVLTRNTSDFARVAGLRFENWLE